MKNLSQTIGAVDAMFENSKVLNDQIFSLAEDIAKQRAKKDGYEAVLSRKDIENAIRYYYRGTQS